MYHPTIIQANVEKYEAATKAQLKRYSVAESQQVTEFLIDRLDEKGKPKTGWKKYELDFMRNEVVLSTLDFRYFAERYSTIPKDGVEGGGTGSIRFWDSQELALKLVEKVQLNCYEAAKRKEPIDGILIAWHKARQLGATELSRVITMHRLCMYRDHRCMAASVDEDKIQELYDRDKLIYDNLPFFMRPNIGFDVKAEHLYFDKLNSRILYQISRQQSGVGQGRQFELAHLTECSSWENAAIMIEMQFFPTLPQSHNTLAILESTANGRGNWWHEFTERVRHRKAIQWQYLFVPWYAESKKYRRQPPVDWQPSELSLLHGQKVYETSPEFVGKQVLLSREQLYWYETTRSQYVEAGTLNIFLTNWCATPEESFQHSNVSAFPPEYLEWARLEASSSKAVPYYFEAA